MAYFRDLVGKKPRPKFWVKTFLHLVIPGGFGYIRKLRAGRDASYVHERDKHEVRHKHHGGGGWKTESEGGLVKRDYASYDEYLTHQKLKLDEMVKMKGGFSNFDIFDYRVKFYVRFRLIARLLPFDAEDSVLWRAARYRGGRAPRPRLYERTRHRFEPRAGQSARQRRGHDET